MTPRRREFGLTWWGAAWIDALEQRAQFDPSRLPRGRTYARQHRVGELVVRPGVVETRVQGSRATPYHVTLRVREFSADEWALVLEAIGGRAAHAAALLDGELLPEVLEDVRTWGVNLLPGPGELTPRCSCPDWAVPCKHASAVCYLVANVLDEDPFELFHLRGRTRDELLASLRARRRVRSVAGTEGVAAETLHRRRASSAPAGVVARDAYASDRSAVTAADLWALGLPPPPPHPGHPAPLSPGPPVASGFSADGLRLLAQDAAQRAWSVVRGTDEPAAHGLSLTEEQDLARRAATLAGTPELTELIHRSGVPERRVNDLAAAWQHGGLEGLAIIDEAWDPEPELTEDGRRAMTAAGLDRIFVRQNRITSRTLQLRVAPSGRWYRFAKVRGHWELADGPDTDPEVLLDLAARRGR